MPVMIGVEPHKASPTAAALDEHGRRLGQQRLPATVDGDRQLRQWAGRWPQRCWAVEGAPAVIRWQLVSELVVPGRDRKLHHALYMLAMVQVRRPSAGQVSYRRKLAAGKSPKEALRCLIG